MTRLPLRLTRELGKVLLAQKLFGADRRPLAARLELPSAPEDLGDSGPTPNELPDASSLLSENNAPIVWVGATSTIHPRIGQIAREFVARKKTVFLEIDGAALRRRIHEFRPVANLFLVYRCTASQPPTICAPETAVIFAPRSKVSALLASRDFTSVCRLPSLPSLPSRDFAT